MLLLGRLEQPTRNKTQLYWHDKPNESTKERPISFVLFETPIISFSTVSTGHLSLVSLAYTRTTISK
jgi:hypothetical protein